MSLYRISAIVSLVAGVAYLAEVTSRPRMRRACERLFASAASIVRDGRWLALSLTASSGMLIVAPVADAVPRPFTWALVLVNSSLTVAVLWNSVAAHRRYRPRWLKLERRRLLRVPLGPGSAVRVFVSLAGLIVGAEHRARYVAEWRGELAVIEGQWAQLRFAISLALHAPRLSVTLRRAARREISD